MKLGSVLLGLILLYACATVTPLSGGDKDVTPPRVLSSIPDSAATAVETNTIRLVFDEFITVQNLTQELLVSPPFRGVVTHRIKNKTLILNLPEPLNPYTTYQFNFGNAIRDVNEQNILSAYTLVFSTGSSLDSGILSGNIINAETLKPQPKATVVLYKEQNDTSIYTSRPYYITKSDSGGRFVFNHIQDTSYSIFAFDDQNGNYHPDADELFAFSVSRLNPGDFIHLAASPEPKRTPIRLSAITSAAQNQYELEFSQALPSNVQVTVSPSDYSYHKSGLLPTHSIKPETLRVFTGYSKEIDPSDSLLFHIQLDDTLELEGVLKDIKTNQSELQINLPDLNQANGKQVVLSSNLPLKSFSSKEVELIRMSDSTQIAIDTILLQNSFQLSLQANLSSGSEYRLILPTSSLKTPTGKNDQPDTVTFRIMKPSELGQLEVIVELSDSVYSDPIYLELYRKSLQSNQTIQSIRIKTDTTIQFSHLKPGEYFIRAFQDSNLDRVWTAGDFLKTRQPEQLFSLDKPIEVRANWETKNIWLKIK
ncbi:MAG: Ig-like domain-containing protein [Flavobacteriales bacterium]|nr:Ig-like domain-containing protein [Flavobacteriales bacterium]